MVNIKNNMLDFIRAGGLGKGFVTNTYTFASLAVPALVFAITGHVVVRVIAVCTTNLASAAVGDIELGTNADPDGLIARTLATDLDAEEIWHDNTPDSTIEALSVIKEVIITNDDDIIITPSAQIDSGVIDFYCFWIPLSSDGSVIAV